MKYRIVLVAGVENNSMVSFAFNFEENTDLLRIVYFPEVKYHSSEGMFFTLPQNKHGEELQELLTSCKNENRTLVITTHSDHMLDALRLLVSKNKLNKEECVIYFIDENKNENKITINENGSLNTWPKGFFDQIEIDAVELLRNRRTKKESK